MKYSVRTIVFSLERFWLSTLSQAILTIREKGYTTQALERFLETLAHYKKNPNSFCND